MKSLTNNWNHRYAWQVHPNFQGGRTETTREEMKKSDEFKRKFTRETRMLIQLGAI